METGFFLASLPVSPANCEPQTNTTQAASLRCGAAPFCCPSASRIVRQMNIVIRSYLLTRDRFQRIALLFAKQRKATTLCVSGSLRRVRENMEETQQRRYRAFAPRSHGRARVRRNGCASWTRLGGGLGAGPKSSMLRSESAKQVSL